MARERKRNPKDTNRKVKKKVCVFCKEKVVWVDYKDVNLLRKFMSDRGKIRARRVSGNCAQHQREVAVAIKTARELALLPYTTRTMSESRAARARTERRGPGAEVPAEAVDTELGDESLDEDAGEVEAVEEGAAE